MRFDLTSLLPFAVAVHAFAVPKEYAFRGPGPFDSECPSDNCVDSYHEADSI